MTKTEKSGPARVAAGGVARFWFGLLATVAAAVVSVLLVLEHTTGMALPGCGAGSACAAAQSSVWGKIPLIEFPVSMVGFAYFVAALAGWVAVSGAVGPAFRFVVRTATLLSLFYLGLIFVKGYFCPYCITAHVCNLIFWATVERSAVRHAPASARIGLATFAVTIVTGAVLEDSVRRTTAEAALRSAEASTARIIAASSQRGEAASSRTSAADGPAFIGRFFKGPRVAPIRLVIFSDYQCPACRNVESEVRQILAARKDVLYSHKQFPVCTDCNPHTTQNMHPNACWAARAAEAAGILRGDEGFWAMHHALFDRGGSFTQRELQEMLTRMGYEPKPFERLMTSPDTLRLVRADIAEAFALGMRYTPMVLINGVEFRGWETPGALTRAVEQLAATNPPPLGPEVDRPLSAVERYLSDWRNQPVRTIDPPEPTFGLGNPTPRVDVVVFGDYEEPVVGGVDQLLRELLGRRSDARYRFQPFPFNKDCNPLVRTTRNANACWAARLAEAAGRLRGAEGYWAVHAWMMSNPGCLRDAELAWAMPELGLDAEVLAAALASDDAARAVTARVAYAQSLGVTSIPTIFINGRLVTMWDHNGENLLPRMIEEAASR
jgi:predicted DsbA family dithiol-disulfide isomerase/uncharacterized membrane protein